MQRIANSGNIKEDSLVGYIVDGIEDHPDSKSSLFNARTFDDLLDAVPGYEKKKEAKPKYSESKRNLSDGHASKRSSPKHISGRCNNCGATNHNSNSGPDKQKGTKCFRCNNFGLIGKNCIQANQKAQLRARVDNH